MIDGPESWETLRKTVYSTQLKPLVTYLVDDTHHPALVNALLALKWHFAAVEASDDRGISQTRSLACEMVAWRFVTHLAENEAIEALCFDLPPICKSATKSAQPHGSIEADSETTPLLDGGSFEPDQSFADEDPEGASPDEATSFAAVFAGLNALEIAAVSEAKKFLSQKSIQRIIDGIWNGEIIFWETLGQHSTKQVKVYNERRSDPFCRLRVPLYSKVFEVMFFAAFLAFYYTVLVEKSIGHVTTAEILLYIWLASFAYNELAEFCDAGSALYSADFWALWDLGIITTGLAFLVVRTIGLIQNDGKLIDIAFDILSVEALFLVPRICSLLSLHPYFGTLLPCLKEMTKDFVKFLGLVAILYVGFNTTFAFLARGVYSVSKMNWILIKVFFGSSYLGFNLLPLLIRPLRLFVSAEDLRTIRIILLKATHWPFVGLILGWEKGRQYWKTRDGRPTASSRDQMRRLITRRPLSGMSFQQPMLSAGTEHPPLEEQARSERLPAEIAVDQIAAPSETIEALTTAVQDLRRQVEALTSLVAERSS
ncbi:hypothetical protein LTR78_002305 [Recurvomyces mirabilis]|uniref:Calcium channel YVC1-like C-terminal transmembrane domain-containing protein n=1 Tax=Recurvomyces mirabilis TaxID=574656 RepID=A0AAE0WU49_9PEZI|nr:hypothetical protein LTR78_002305 [Recurvomyces mirabilis]KAK5160760.1 hypothetical protein LTS14_001773 [Recurvomyces mirabilis]